MKSFCDRAVTGENFSVTGSILGWSHGRSRLKSCVSGRQIDWGREAV